jgi:quercetin dioxygenase-like cupin family protein
VPDSADNYFASTATTRKPGVVGAYSNLDDLTPIDAGGGVTLRALGGDAVMLSHVTIEPNGSAASHTHDEEQMGLIIAGGGVFELDGVKKEVGPGDVYHAPPGVPHGLTAGPEGCVVVDAFSPPRAALVARLT